MTDPSTFTFMCRRLGDGTVIADARPPDRIRVCGELLNMPARWLESMYGLSVRGDVLDVRLSNGRWIYQIVEEIAGTSHGGARPDVYCDIRYREDSF